MAAAAPIHDRRTQASAAIRGFAASFATASLTRAENCVQKNGGGSGTSSLLIASALATKSAAWAAHCSQPSTCWRRLGVERAVEQVDEFRLGEVCAGTGHHSLSRSSFFRFASAWKKFAFTAPTELPRIEAISSWGSS